MWNAQTVTPRIRSRQGTPAPAYQDEKSKSEPRGRAAVPPDCAPEDYLQVPVEQAPFEVRHTVGSVPVVQVFFGVQVLKQCGWLAA